MSRDRMPAAVAVSSTLLLAMIALAWIKNDRREYRQVQRAYERLTGDRHPALAGRRGDVGVLQIHLGALGRTERCVSCHLGVDDPRAEGAALPFRSHSAVVHAPDDFERIGCVSCHGGQSFATTSAAAHGRTPHWPLPLVPSRHIESRCGICHSSTSLAEAPALTRGRALITRLGCANCHSMGGSWAAPAAGPPLEGMRAKVSRAWLRRWLQKPADVDRNARMPDFHLAPGDIEALVEYLFSLPPPASITAGDADLPVGGDAEAGARLFRTARCISCHTLDGKGHGSAPELAQVGSKASRAWLYAFLKYPHEVYPRTSMPAYTLPPAALADLVAYLAEELRDFDRPEPRADERAADPELAEAGRALYARYACTACHGQPETRGEPSGPDLSGVADASVAAVDFGARRDLPRELPAWLRAKVIEPRSFGPGLRMPSFPLTDQQAADVVTALLSLARTNAPASLTPPVPAARPSPRPPAGAIGRLFAKYRCLACHEIGSAGSTLSTAPLTFQGSKTRRAWLADYLILPETIYPLLPERMPVLGITAAEARQIADYIAAVFVDDAIAATPFGSEHDAAAVASGAALFERKGCRACHMVGKSGGYVGPPLSTSGDRLEPSWMAYWLENPQRWRRESRCPNYGLSQDEIRGLTAFLGAQHGPRARR